MTWVDTRLKHVCVDAGQYGLNISAEKYVDSGTRLIRTSDISSNGSLVQEDGVYVDVSLEARHLLREGDILLSRSGTLGRSFLAPREAEGQTFAGFLVRFRPKNTIEPRYLHYVTLSDGFQDVIKSEAVSSTIQNFNAERYASINIRVPPMKEQRRIANFLDAETSRIDQLIHARNRQILLLKERWDSLLASETDELYGRFGAVSLGRVTFSLEQGWSPQCDDMEAALDEWAVLKTSAVSSGRFKPFEHKRLPSHIMPDIRYRISDGDILLTRGSGSPENVGVAVVAETEGRRLLLSDLLYRLRIDPSWSPRYVCLVLRSAPVRGRISLLLRGQSGQTIKLRSQDIRAIDVPNLPVDQQEKIVLALRGLESSIGRAMDALKQSVSLLEEKQRALVTAAVTGQFDVTTASGRNLTEGV